MENENRNFTYNTNENIETEVNKLRYTDSYMENYKTVLKRMKENL